MGIENIMRIQDYGSDHNCVHNRRVYCSND